MTCSKMLYFSRKISVVDLLQLFVFFKIWWVGVRIKSIG